jgi:putative transposase
MLVDDGVALPESSADGDVIGIDMGLIDFAVTSNGSKYQHPRPTKKHERNLKRKQKKLDRKTDKRLTIDDRRSWRLPRFIQKLKESARIFYINYRAT